MLIIGNEKLMICNEHAFLKLFKGYLRTILSLSRFLDTCYNEQKSACLTKTILWDPGMAPRNLTVLKH
jgi:hypothetical protein